MNKRILLAAIAVPIFSLIFMATIFGDGKIENLPVGVADYSGSLLSQEVIRTIEASPTLHIAPQHIFSNEAAAKLALQKMEIYGYAVIPDNFTEQLYNGISPTITYVYHNAMLAIGGEVRSAFVKALGKLSTTLVETQGNLAGIPGYRVEGIELPSDAIFGSTYNASLNYSTFLSYPFFFIFFQIFILTFTVYVIGRNITPQYLAENRGNILKALAVKLFPYTCIFITEALLANWILFKIAHIPLQGSMAAITANSILLILSTIALGTAIISLIPKLSIAISIASMIGALGATASGVTFPIENMYPLFRIICSAFPVRHFILGYQSSLYNDSSFAYSWPYYAALLASTAIFLCTIPLLKKAIKKGKCKPLPVMWGTSLVILGGSIGYGILYGLLYNPNIVTDVPIAVIDHSQSPQSREYLRNLNATQQIKIYAECQNLPQAVTLMKQGKAKGIITLPADFTTLIAQGEEACFTVLQTTTSFLYYLTIQEGVASTMQEENNSLRSTAATTLALPQQLLISQAPTVQYNDIPIYNHNGGYGSYLLPIALIIIIFQTMLMSGGILGGNRTHSPLRYIPLLAIGYFLLSFFIVGLVPLIFNLPALAAPSELYLFMALFIITCAAFTGAVSPLFKDPEEVMLWVPFFSVGLIFLSGSSFPLNQIPHFWQIIHYIFPSSPGIIGYIKLNSMGSTLQNVSPQIITLIAQLLIYSSIFTLHLRRLNKQNNL